MKMLLVNDSSHKNGGTVGCLEGSRKSPAKNDVESVWFIS